MEKPFVEKTSTYWSVFTKINFIIAIVAIGISVYNLDAPLVVKGYYILASLYLFTTTVILTKTIRDEDESRKMINRIEEAKTNKILKDYVSEE